MTFRMKYRRLRQDSSGNTEGLTAEETPAEPVHEISAVDVTETDNDESDSEE